MSTTRADTPSRHVDKAGRVPLKQLLYRNYKHTMIIYHYSTDLLPVSQFRKRLEATENSYSHNLIGPDPLHDFTVPEGDEVPPNCVEVGYLPGAFQNKGSALGFRDYVNNSVEWLCFRSPAEALIENAKGDSGQLLFDKVAYLEKDEKDERGHAEHEAWFESVRSSKQPRMVSIDVGG
jgi:hypothetical protein